MPIEDQKTKYRSLFIISVPRSATTTLEGVCAKALRPLAFQSYGEILNRGYNPQLKIGQYAKKDEQFERLQTECSKYIFRSIIRDVIQPHFIVCKIEWILNHFNVLFIVRSLDEIMVSRKRLGWKMPRKTVARYRKMLLNISECDRFQRIDYYDFIRDNPELLVQILQKWYPACPTFDYWDTNFLTKRRRTFNVVQQAGVCLKKNEKSC